MKWLKKWWWLLTIIFSVALVIGWEEKRCQTQSYQCRASYMQQAQSERLSGNVSVNQQASEQQAIAAACETDGYFCRLFGAANLPTMLLVLIGIGGIWAALRTLGAIERQANIMDKALKVIEAADVAIESVSLVPAGAINPDSHIGLRLKNVGRTRAENVRSYIVTTIPGCPNSEPSPDTFSIAAGGTQLVGFLNFRQFLNEETFRKIENGIISVRFSGKVTYEDRFEDSHVFECRGVLDPKTGTFVLGDSDPRNKNQNPN